MCVRERERAWAHHTLTHTYRHSHVQTHQKDISCTMYNTFRTMFNWWWLWWFVFVKSLSRYSLVYTVSTYFFFLFFFLSFHTWNNNNNNICLNVNFFTSSFAAQFCLLLPTTIYINDNNEFETYIVIIILFKISSNSLHHFPGNISLVEGIEYVVYPICISEMSHTLF